MSPVGTHRKFGLADKIAASWMAIGSTLGIEPSTLEEYSKKKSKTYNLRRVFIDWIEREDSLPNLEDYPCSWQGLYNLLEDSDLVDVAKEYFEFMNEAKL